MHKKVVARLYLTQDLNEPAGENGFILVPIYAEKCNAGWTL